LFNCPEIANSPFSTKLVYPPPASNCNAPTSTDEYSKETFNRMCNAYQYGAFKLYPQDYLVGKDKVYLAQEGDWNSLREQRHCCNR
jgi:hypothetical protein